MVFVGTIFFTAFIFILFVLIARHISNAEFGFFCLGYAVIKILSAISGLGFNRGIPRYISFQIGKGKKYKARSAIYSSFVITTLFSLFLAGLLFLNAGFVSSLFNKPGMAGTLKTMSLIIPFMTLNELLSSYLRGLKDATGKVYFQQILRPLFAVGLVSSVVIFSLSYIWVLRVYAISFVLTFILLFFYAKRKIFNYFPVDSYVPVAKEIIVFSLPLLGAGLVFQIMMWTDTLVLGFLTSARFVGVYHCALRIAMFLTITVISAGFIYLPLVSDFYSQKNLQKIRALYAVVTKWTFVITLPLFYFILFAQEQVLFYSFSAKYITAGAPLKILAIGYIISTFFGLNGATCIALGKTRVIIISQVIALVVNLSLDLLLIPKYGIIGASIASSVSLVLVNIIMTGYVYGISGVHPFSKRYMFLGVYAIGLGIIFSLIPLNRYLSHSILYVILFFGVLMALSFLGVIITRNFTQEDASLIRYIEEKVSRNTRFTDRFLKYLIAY